MKQIFCVLTYLASTLLWAIANPRGLWQTIAQSGGQVLAVARRLRQGDGDLGDTAVSFALPFHNEWFIVNGGITQASSHSWSVVAQRYAYDFVIRDKNGENYAGSGRKPKDYFCFGQPILAAAAGEVVAVRDDVADYGRCGSCWIDWRTRDIRGNHLVIRHAPGVYSLSAHLQQGSIQVAVGDQVARGQQIARCGNSGHSTEPHLHFQVQDHPNFFLAVGRPIRFEQFVQQPVDGGAATAVLAGYATKAHVVVTTENTEGQTMPPPAANINFMDLLSSAVVFVFGLGGIAYILIEFFGWLMRLLTS